MASYTYINENGVIVPDTSETLATIQDEWRNTFGQDLIVTPDTPQGVMIAAETIARNNLINNNAVLANQINPNIAGGAFLDAIMALMGIGRKTQNPTVVSNVTITGVPSTLVPLGSQAKTLAGDVFELTSDVTIPSGGSTTGNFQSIEYGAIPCAIGELNQIVTAILGWETVTNPAAGVLGNTTQSDQQARAYRTNTLAYQGCSLAQAITSALYTVAGVKSLSFRENTDDTTQVIDGISMVSHSVYACVDGGTDLDVATALLENKNSGCSWNGGTLVGVIDPASGQSYSVKFDRPTPISILIRATVKNGASNDVINAIMSYVNGEIENETGFVVGQSVSPFEIASAINNQFPSIYVKKIEISLSSPISYTTNEIAIAIDEIAYTQSSYITVVIA
jgi:hypothetical protein